MTPRRASRIRVAARRFPPVLALLLGTGVPAGEPDEAQMELGRSVFTQIAQPSCAICHTLKDAGTTGTVGPSLDELNPDAERVALAVRKGVGVMPPYQNQLTDAQIEAVAAYVARATSRAQ